MSAVPADEKAINETRKGPFEINSIDELATLAREIKHVESDEGQEITYSRFMRHTLHYTAPVSDLVSFTKEIMQTHDISVECRQQIGKWYEAKESNVRFTYTQDTVEKWKNPSNMGLSSPIDLCGEGPLDTFANEINKLPYADVEITNRETGRTTKLKFGDGKIIANIKAFTTKGLHKKFARAMDALGTYGPQLE